MSGAAAVLAGIGSFLPPCLVTNEELAARLGSSDEWIRSRTGIRRRYVATGGVETSDLAAGAGGRALKPSGDSRVNTVVATTTADRPCPATAPAVAGKLGLGHAAAYDVAAVCTGFIYALATASGLIAGGTSRRAPVIGTETFSRLLSPRDRTTAVLFGDGAGAVVLRAGHRVLLTAFGGGLTWGRRCSPGPPWTGPDGSQRIAATDRGRQ